jgi:hypothetical protein
MEQETITFAGRDFYIPTDRSIANDLWIEAEASAAGLADLHVEEGEDAVKFAARILSASVTSGKLLRLLGGLLFPCGVMPEDWSPATADDTARLLARVTDPEEKDAIRSIIAAVLARFFLSGVASATTSASSLTRAGQTSDLSSVKPIGEA